MAFLADLKSHYRGETESGSASGSRRLVSAAFGSLLFHAFILLGFARLEEAPGHLQPVKIMPVDVVFEPPRPAVTQEQLPETEAPRPMTKTPQPEPPAARRDAEMAEESKQRSGIAVEASEKRARTKAPPASIVPSDSGGGARTGRSGSARTDLAWRGTGGVDSEPVSRARTNLPIDHEPYSFRAVAVPRPVKRGGEPTAYKIIVASLLERAKHFPETARARGARGIAVIRFSLDNAGGVSGVALLASSGDVELDRESVALIGRAAPFPVPPAGVQRSFAVDIAFGMGR